MLYALHRFFIWNAVCLEEYLVSTCIGIVCFFRICAFHSFNLPLTIMFEKINFVRISALVVNRYSTFSSDIVIFATSNNLKWLILLQVQCSMHYMSICMLNCVEIFDIKHSLENNQPEESLKNATKYSAKQTSSQLNVIPHFIICFPLLLLCSEIFE